MASTSDSKEFDDLSRFFLLRPPSADSRTWVWAGFTKEFLRRQSPDWYGHASRGKAPMPDGPIEIYAYLGKNIPARLGFDGAIIICTNEFLEALESHGAKFEINHPARLLAKDEKTLLSDNLRWIKPVCGAGPVDLGRGSSLISTKEWNDDPSIPAYGVYFDPSTWTGAPVFHFERAPFELVMIESVAKDIQARNFPGIKIDPLPEVGKDLYNLLLANMRPQDYN